jgi:hypothetical protein
VPEWLLFALVCPLILAWLAQRMALVVVAFIAAAPYLAVTALLHFTPLDLVELVWYVCLPLAGTSPVFGRLIERRQRRRLGLQRGRTRASSLLRPTT